MKRILTLISCVLLFAAGTALADGQGEWLYSRLHGWIQLASYVGRYDGYVSVDGYGGISTADSFRVTVISKNASVWSEPRTGSRKLASIGHGKNLEGRAEDGGGSAMWRKGFYAVETGGKNGWINEDYVVVNDLTVTLLESNVPAYIAPDTSSKKVGSLSKLTSYRVVGFYDDFYIVNLRDAAVAYIPMSVQHRDNTFDRNYHRSGGYRKTEADGKVTLRTGPGSQYPEVRTLKAGAQITVYDVIDDWYLIKDSETGEWVFAAPDSLSVPM